VCLQRVHKLQICKVSHLQMVHKSNILLKSATLRICDLRNLFADRPTLYNGNMERRAQVRPACEIFEQYEQWTEPQLNLSSNRAC
jgi:hypothetical protein